MDLKTIKIIQKMTKNEILLYQLIKDNEPFDWSLSKISELLGISRTTAVKSLQNLVDYELVTKNEFYVGKLKKCKYTIVNNFFNS